MVTFPCRLYSHVAVFSFLCSLLVALQCLTDVSAHHCYAAALVYGSEYETNPHCDVCAMQNLKLVENVKKLAAKKNVTAGQMALAWLQHQVSVLVM